MKLATLIVAVLALATALAMADSPTSAPAQNTPATAQVSANEMVKESFSPLDGTNDMQHLHEAIERLKATKIKVRHEWPALPAAAQQPVVERPVTQPTVTIDVPKGMPTTQPAVLNPDELATLATLKDLSPEQASSLAAALHKAGYEVQAFGFYEQAMKASQGSQQAFLLLQMAHCKRTADPVTAQTLYRRVAVDFKDTPWATLAAAYDRSIDFDLVHKPAQTIANATSEPSFGLTIMHATTASSPTAPAAAASKTTSAPEANRKAPATTKGTGAHE